MYKALIQTNQQINICLPHTYPRLSVSILVCASDKRIHRDDEFYDSDDEYPTGGATDMDRDRHKHKHKRPRTETEKNTEHSTG